MGVLFESLRNPKNISNGSGLMEDKLSGPLSHYTKSAWKKFIDKQNKRRFISVICALSIFFKSGMCINVTKLFPLRIPTLIIAGEN